MELTQSQTIAINIMFAEFLGAKITQDGEYELYGYIDSIEDGEYEQHFFLPEEMLFDSDWNWIMSVVRNMSNRGYSGGMMEDLKEALTTGDLDRAFKALVEIVEFMKTRN